MGLGDAPKKRIKAKYKNAAPPPPPPPPPIDHIAEVLQRIINTAPAMPSQAEFLAPLVQAEQRLREGYQATLPAVDQSTATLKGALSEGLARFQQDHAALQQARAAQAAQAESQVRNLQAQAAQTSQNLGPAMPVNSDAAGAAAQAGVNLAALQTQAANAQSSSQGIRQSMEGQFADRQAGAATMDQAAKQYALVQMNKYLGAIESQKAQAAGKYAEAQNQALRERQSAELDLAKYQASKQADQDPLESLKREIQEIELRNRRDELVGLPRVRDFLGAKRREGWGTSADYLEDLFDQTYDVNAIMSQIDKDAERSAKEKKTDGKHIWYQGKKLNKDVLKQWAREARR